MTKFKIYLFFAFAVYLAAGFSYPALAADLYTIQHVKVDETDESAAQAKIKALAAGQKKSFDTLLSRLVREEYRAQLPDFDNRFISRYFAGLSVEEEKTSTTRYIATLTYRFKAKEVRDMLLSYGVPFQENRAASVLIIPVWIDEGKNILFEDKNPWRDAWLKIDSSNSLTPVLVPLGDQTDKDALSASDALKLKETSFEKLKKRYSVSHVIVAAARPNQTLSALNVYLRGKTSSGKIDIEDAVAGKQGDLEELVLRAANGLLRQIEQHYKRATATRGVEADNLLSVSVPFNSFQEWNFLKTRIENTEGVQSVEIRQLSSTIALIDIVFSGDIAGLNKRLSREKLALRDEGANWTIGLLDETHPAQNFSKEVPSGEASQLSRNAAGAAESVSEKGRGEIEVQPLPPQQ